MKVLVVIAALVACVNGLGQDPANFWVDIQPTAPQTVGMGLCHVRYLGATATVFGMLEVRCIHNVPAPTAAHIHIGAAGASGAVQFGFTSGMSPLVMTTAALSKEQEDALFTMGLYVNIHTDVAQNGHARGQIMPGTAGVWLAELTNIQEGGATPPTTGTSGVAWVKRSAAAPFTYDFKVHHTIGNATWGASAGHIHGPSSAPGNSTGVLIGFCSTRTGCASPIMVNAVAEPAVIHYSYIKAGITYVNLHNPPAYGGGEIRGQLRAVMGLTQFMRSAAPSLTVGIPVFAVALLALFALLF